MASHPAERLGALKAFDDTKAGVKGLVDAGVTAVPSIFHHPPEPLPLDESPPDRHGQQQHFTIPVIDLAAGDRAGLVAQVKAAAETVGFFQVVNHGVPEAAMSDMLACVRRFHESPAEAKAPYYSRDPGRRVRYQSNFDLFQSPAASWRDTLFMETAPAPEEAPPECRAVALEYMRLVRELGRALLELLSEGLGLDPRFLEQECLDGHGLTVAGHYYPACPEPRLTMGTTRHSDPSFITVLLQDAVGGLQVLVDRLDEDGNKQPAAWVDVPAVPGALVVNVGDYLQLVSNDRFKSVEHRVVASGVGPRVSVACFLRTDTSTKVLTPMVTGDHGEARYKSTTVAELVKHYRAKGLDGTSSLQHLRV
ncbi:1-aminocyclopropane-1-carboxylate oxidase homolog 1 [Lolium perenne]|uniref:1-aminocyclopropane-1-carboxylate oxidase homolog 1 n=1 Tax=Lolium perenne TaxID=4522 RepID=UPI0021F5CDA2|nr:1-aminocyclopropane-1-carboxylate oxidase homolog 1-like [Lolium perenne]